MTPSPTDNKIVDLTEEEISQLDAEVVSGKRKVICTLSYKHMADRAAFDREYSKQQKKAFILRWEKRLIYIIPLVILLAYLWFR